MVNFAMYILLKTRSQSFLFLLLIAMALTLTSYTSEVPQIKLTGESATLEAPPGCGASCLHYVSKYFGIPTSPSELSGIIGERNGISTMLQLRDAAKSVGLQAGGYPLTFDKLAKLREPCIIPYGKDHFVVLERIEQNTVYLYDPNKGPLTLSGEEFLTNWVNHAGLVLRRATTAGAAPDGSTPHISLVHASYDFGKVNQGEIIRHSFEIKNTGGETLLIHELKKSCNCTSTVARQRTIPAGGASYIDLTYDTRDRRGKQTVDVYMSTNAPDQETMKLAMTGTVIVGPTFAPQRIDFGQVRQKEEKARTLYVLDDRGQEFEILDARTQSELVDVRIERYSVGGWARFLVELQVNDERRPVGEFSDMLTLITNDPLHTEIKVPVTGIVLGEYIIEPEKLFFGARRGESAQGSFSVTATGDNMLQISQVKSDEEWITVSLSRSKNDENKVLVNVAPKDFDKTLLRGKIFIEFEDKSISTTIVPVSVMIN